MGIKLYSSTSEDQNVKGEEDKESFSRDWCQNVESKEDQESSSRDEDQESNEDEEDEGQYPGGPTVLRLCA